MEIFMNNIPQTIKEKQLRQALNLPLKSFEIHAYHAYTYVSKSGKNKNGVLVVPCARAGQKFLDLYGERPTVQKWSHLTGRRIMVGGATIRFRLSNRAAPPDRHLISSLVKENETKKIAEALLGLDVQRDAKLSNKAVEKAQIVQLECGTWTTNPNYPDTPTFVSFYKKTVLAKLNVARQALQFIISDAVTQDKTEGEFIFFKATARSLVVTTEGPDMFVAMTLHYPPRIYNITEKEANHRQPGPTETKTIRERIPSWDEEHSNSAPYCFVYRLKFAQFQDVENFFRAGQSWNELAPDRFHTRTEHRLSLKQSIPKVLDRLNTKIEGFDFRVTFQLNKLVYNGILLPDLVELLLPQVQEMVDTIGDSATADLLNDWAQQSLPQDAYSNPTLWTANACIDSLKNMLTEFKACPREVSEMRQYRQSRMTWVHRVNITPCGIYLKGPIFEQRNRVLRKYIHHNSCFIRVSVVEEDGQELAHEKHTSFDKVIERHIRPYFGSLVSKLRIGQQYFHFLGYSQSSLRNHSCWFMCTFRHAKEGFVGVDTLIRNLGDFSGIRLPGRYAARVGQAFTDTSESINIYPDEEEEIADVERNGRVFSDGCGTISFGLLQKIYRAGRYSNEARCPTVFQIRFGGAKGVVSFDNQLGGNMIRLRPSMIKFRGSNDRGFEICMAANKPLPMHMNRSLIKILEDQGINPQRIMDLQDEALSVLLSAMDSPANASFFMERYNAGVSLKLPGLIRSLHVLNMNWHEDPFLSQVVELRLIVAFRDLKYKARIPITKGVVLLGIMDETGYLKENEVYCVRDEHGKRVIIRGRVMISRSPALHPGDVRTVFAVTVPDDSSLRALSNCIVFSQHGPRDLPSMLSGGDLDGDQFSVVWDKQLIPDKFNENPEPADYPRVQADAFPRPIEQKDIANFFLDFILNDRIGTICNAHMVLADKEDQGVFHQDCIKLAEMASIAVDFPKTGVKVNMDEMPRNKLRVKPDFLAPSPHVAYENKIKIQDISQNDYDEDEEDHDLLNPPQVRYYESQKLLGQLYRKIDENKFLSRIQGYSREPGVPLLRRVFHHILDKNPDRFDKKSKETITNFAHFALDLCKSYQTNIQDLSSCYAQHRFYNLRESEIINGCILGAAKQTHRQRELSDNLKSETDKLMEYTRRLIEFGSTEETSKSEVLERSIACIMYALREQERLEKDAKNDGSAFGIRSFGWLAAEIAISTLDVKLHQQTMMNVTRKLEGLHFPSTSFSENSTILSEHTSNV